MWELVSHPFWAIAMGLCIGSFANVLIHRVPREQSVFRPRSRCPQCKKSIPVWGNIPLLSYGLLRGKCAHCRKPISLRYPVVEGMIALLFYAAYLYQQDTESFPWGVWIRDWPFLTFLVVVTFIDIDYRIIPDRFSWGGAAIGLLTAGFMPDVSLEASVWGFGVGFGVFFLFAWLYERISGKSGLGGGDIKLLGMIGAFLGVQGVLITILVSSVLGSVTGVIWALAAGQGLRQFAIPYGPFLAIGALISYFFGEGLWHQFMTPI